MNLTRYQVDVAVYAIYQAIELSGLVPNSRVRPAVYDVLQELNDLLEVACDHESESGSPAEELVADELIGTTKVAEMLDCSPQWVRHISKDLSRRRCPCG